MLSATAEADQVNRPGAGHIHFDHHLARRHLLLFNDLRDSVHRR